MTFPTTDVPADTPYEIRPRSRYIDTFAGFGDAEMQALCEVKRFIECYEGDRDFRAAVDAGGAFSDQQRQMMRDIGISFEPEAMALLWIDPDFTARFNRVSHEATSFDEMPPEFHETLAGYPLLRIWMIWKFRRAKSYLVQMRTVLTTPTASPAFTAWRARRLNAARNELGHYGWDIDHPCHAVEMAVGCSVGCGFCAFDAQKLETVFDYGRPENRELIRGVAAGMARRLGWPAAHGMLYWSTEPNDNPNYVDFLAEWESVTGAVLCTATARANDDWVEKLRAYYGRVPAPWPRISVLSRNIMRKLHKRFTPAELRDTTLLMQQTDAEFMRAKVPGGRERMLQRLIEADDLRTVDFDNPPATLDIPQGSIACVSGLLINLVNRTVKLISPCYTSLQHRYGYRVYDEARFAGAEDFETVLGAMIARSMVLAPYPEMPVKWRDDLKYVPREDGFSLVSPTTLREFRGRAVHRAAGPMIARGDMTHNAIFEALADDPSVGPMAALAILESLFGLGYLCEIAITADYRRRQEAVRPIAAAEPA